MNIYREKGTGKIAKQGRKTDKMLEVESKLGRTLEEDYGDMFPKLGVNGLAKRWLGRTDGRRLIFDRSDAKRRNRSSPCWVDRLQLPHPADNNKNIVWVTPGEMPAATMTAKPVLEIKCPICDCILDAYNQGHNAHWLSASKGGNLTIKTCANCNQRMLNKDPTALKKYLLFLLNNTDKWTWDKIKDLIGGIEEYKVQLAIKE